VVYTTCSEVGPVGLPLLELPVTGPLDAEDDELEPWPADDDEDEELWPADDDDEDEALELADDEDDEDEADEELDDE